MPVAPADFKYCIESTDYASQGRAKVDHELYGDNAEKQYFVKYNRAIPLGGRCELQIPDQGPISVYVENHFKSQKLFVWFKTKEDLERYNRFKNPTPEKQDQVEIFVRVLQGWQKSRVCIDLSLSQYVGYQHYFHQIVREITDWQTNQGKLNRINLQSGKNFLLYGVPGSGKTSLIRLIAQYFKVPIFVGSGGRLDVSNPNSPFSICIWEDFDRYLTEAQNLGSSKDSSYMSNILNTLDGVDTQSNVVRFFTGNDCTIVRQNKALNSRMSASYYFQNPGKEMYDAKIKAIDAELETSLADSPRYDNLLDSFLTAGLSMREVVIILVRHIFHPDPCDRMLDELRERSELSGHATLQI